MTTIHPLAVVDPKAKLGTDVTVMPFAYIEADVEIGDRTSVGVNAAVYAGSRIGSDCKIFQGAAVGQVSQDLKFKGEYTFLKIGDRTTVREFCTLNRGTAARGETVIGADCLLMAYCHVAHDCVLGHHVIASNNLGMAGHVEVGNYVTIGGMVPIHQFVRFGDYSMIASACRPFKDVVPYALCGGEADTRIVGVNTVKLERLGFSEERRRIIKRAFKILFREGLTQADALARLESEYAGHDDIINLVTFVKGSSRGILRMDESSDL